MPVKQNTAVAYPGMRVEVLNLDNRLLFVAKIRNFKESLTELERVSELFSSDVGSPQSVYIRGFNEKRNIGVRMEGTLKRFTQTRDNIWLVERIRILRTDSGRSFQRQYTQIAGTITRADPIPATAAACHIKNISAGGVCVLTQEPFQKGDQVLVQIQLRRSKDQRPLSCVIRRVTEYDPGEYEYGCEFVQLDEAVESQIAKTMIEVQLMGLNHD